MIKAKMITKVLKLNKRVKPKRKRLKLDTRPVLALSEMNFAM